MSDITSSPEAGPPRSLLGMTMPTGGDLRSTLLRGDIGLAVGIMLIMVILILPMPAMMLDFMLACVDHLLGSDHDDGACSSRRRSSSRPFRPSS